MKKSELKRIIKEEIHKVLSSGDMQVISSVYIPTEHFINGTYDGPFNETVVKQHIIQKYPYIKSYGRIEYSEPYSDDEYGAFGVFDVIETQKINENDTKYQIIYDDFVYYKQFDSEQEAKDFALDHSFENQEEKYMTVTGEDGHEYQDYVYDYITYYNPPESDETQNKVLGPFMGFSIEPIQNIHESLEKYIGGLYQAKPGDYIQIGVQGSRGKWITKIVKELPTNRLVDQDGNIFNKNGIIAVKKSYPWKAWGDKIISAKIVTQQDFDKQYKDIKIDFLRKFDWGKLDIKDIEHVIDSIPNYNQANRLNTSRFTK